MASFKDKMKNKQTIGNRVVNSDEAIGLVFHDETSSKLVNVDLTALEANPYQPRKYIDENEIIGLASSISNNGLIQPIIITPIENQKNKFFIVAGHRRVEAIKFLKKDTIKAIIINLSHDDLQANALIENIQRKDLTVIEEAFAIKQLAEKEKYDKVLCDVIGKSESTISRLISLTTLNKDVINYLTNNQIDIGMSLLVELLRIKDKEQFDTLKLIIDQNMKREDIRKYISNKKIAPAQLNGFMMKKTKDSISFKINFKKMTNKEEAIEKLENILQELKEYKNE